MGPATPNLAILYGDLFDLSERERLESLYSAHDLQVEFREDCDLPPETGGAAAVVVDLDDPRFTRPEFLVALAKSVGIQAVTGASRNPQLDVTTFARLGVSRVLSPEQCLEHLHRFLSSLEKPSQEQPAAPAAPQLAGFIGSSGWMREIQNIVATLSEVDFPMALILGETGTGKSLVARILHQSGIRRDHHLVEVNCSAIPDGLFESELFGHRKGAFTDAKSDKQGLFEFAQDGTLFLDEIGNLSLAAQAKLLKVLEDRRLRRVGEIEEREINVRVLAATNRDLEECVADGTFREDLYYRFNLLSIRVPPLRERLEDIHQLARHYIRYYGTNYDKPAIALADEAMAKLAQYHWPGNVRELCNVLERAVLLNSSGVVRADDIHVAIARNRSYKGGRQRISFDLPPEGMALRDMDREIAKQVLNLFDGNRSKAASYLGISRPRLRRILEVPPDDESPNNT